MFDFLSLPKRKRLWSMKFSRPGSSRSRHSSDGFDINASHTVNEITRLVVSSGVPQVSVHAQVDGKIHRRTFYNPQAQRTSSSGQLHESQPRISATKEPRSNAGDGSHIVPVSQVDEAGGNDIYAIASLTKILINVLYSRLISKGLYKEKGLSWDKSACDLFNGARAANGKTPILRFSRDPTILELLLHRNGFAPMNRELLGPEETFLLSTDEFLEIAPLITEEYFKGGKQGWSIYSNANHIFAGLILEEITGQKLSKLMQDVLFTPLDMKHTTMDKSALSEMETAGCNIVQGYRVLGDMTRRIPLPEQKYLADTVEAASLGARSCTQDLAKLIDEYMKSLDDLDSLFQEEEVLHFFGPKCDSHDGGKVALGGLLCASNSTFLGGGSLDRLLAPTYILPPYELGRLPSGLPASLYYTAGSVDGFCSSIYISLKERAFVIVLANSTGPLDVSDHIARYLLQGILALSPPADVVDNAIKQGRMTSRIVQEYEREDMDLSGWSDDVEAFLGTYTHVKYGQKLDISTGGYVTLSGKEKSSSKMRARVSGDKLRIFPGSEGFGIERWSVWKNRDFTLQNRKDEILLIGALGHVYKKDQPI